MLPAGPQKLASLQPLPEDSPPRGICPHSGPRGCSVGGGLSSWNSQGMQLTRRVLNDLHIICIHLQQTSWSPSFPGNTESLLGFSLFLYLPPTPEGTPRMHRTGEPGDPLQVWGSLLDLGSTAHSNQGAPPVDTRVTSCAQTRGARGPGRLTPTRALPSVLLRPLPLRAPFFWEDHPSHHFKHI